MIHMSKWLLEREQAATAMWGSISEEVKALPVGDTFLTFYHWQLNDSVQRAVKRLNTKGPARYRIEPADRLYIRITRIL